MSNVNVCKYQCPCEAVADHIFLELQSASGQHARNLCFSSSCGRQDYHHWRQRRHGRRLRRQQRHGRRLRRRQRHGRRLRRQQRHGRRNGRRRVWSRRRLRRWKHGRQLWNRRRSVRRWLLFWKWEDLRLWRWRLQLWWGIVLRTEMCHDHLRQIFRSEVLSPEARLEKERSLSSLLPAAAQPP